MYLYDSNLDVTVEPPPRNDTQAVPDDTHATKQTFVDINSYAQVWYLLGDGICL